MKRRFLYNILIASSLASIMACSDNDAANGTYTVGEANNEMRFATGVVSASNATQITRGNNTAMTRAYNTAAPMTRGYNTTAYKFLPLAAGTNLHIKTEGTWTGKPNDGAITHYTQTGTAKAPVSDASASEIEGVGIYWDDYGTGDPANFDNRTAGINVYAACIDGKPASAIGTISDWESLSWTLPANMATWKDKDLLISNNNSDEGATNSNGMNKADVGRYKFATQKAGTACNLELHHAMSKITVNLKAGKGFVVDGVAKFQNTPTVTLKSIQLGGTVNIKTLTATASGSGSATDATLVKTSNTTTGYTATYEGLVFPGNSYSATTDKVATINCDGNIFNIYAKELMEAMEAAESSTTDHAYHSGKNYILNITVDKTEIKVTATVVNWVDVEANPIEPKIEVTTSLGDKGATGEGFTSFNFYMRKDGTSDNYAVYGGTATGTKADGTTPWSFTNPIYWPSHDTHYHMRGVYPSSTTVTANKIAVTNSTYDAASAPSNLMVGAPELTAGTMCDNQYHTSVDMSLHGICAREASINLNFRYMMSQVEVHLVSEGVDAVSLTNAVVEVINGYTAANVDINSRTITDRSTVANFTIAHSGTEDANYRHSVIVPQDLTNDTKDLLFRITITNSDGTQDYYYATIKDIAVSENGGTATTISAWEAGKRYVYTLNMKKTKINITATIKDWIESKGSTNIWM